MPVLTDEDLLHILETQLPALLDRHPELQERIYAAFLRTFVRREELAAILVELRELREDFDGFRQEMREFRDESRRETRELRASSDEIRQETRELRASSDEMRQETRQFRTEFTEFRDETSQQFEQVDQEVRNLAQRFDDLQDWVELVVGRLQVRSGRNLENVVASALRLALKRPDIRPESIRLRQKIVDEEGRVFPRGRQKEIDLVAADNEYLVFEVKSAAEPDDVEYFADKVELVQILNPGKSVRGVFITLAPEPDVQQRCQELGIELAR